LVRCPRASVAWPANFTDGRENPPWNEVTIEEQSLGVLGDDACNGLLPGLIEIDRSCSGPLGAPDSRTGLKIVHAEPPAPRHARLEGVETQLRSGQPERGSLTNLVDEAAESSRLRLPRWLLRARRRSTIAVGSWRSRPTRVTGRFGRGRRAGRWVRVKQSKRGPSGKQAVRSTIGPAIVENRSLRWATISVEPREVNRIAHRMDHSNRVPSPPHQVAGTRPPLDLVTHPSHDCPPISSPTD